MTISTPLSETIAVSSRRIQVRHAVPAAVAAALIVAAAVLWHLLLGATVLA